MDRSVLLDALRDFASAIRNPFDVEDAVTRLAHLSATVVHASGAGVLLTDDDGVLRFAGATDAWTALVDRGQAAYGEGPCHDAVRRFVPVAVPDLRLQRPWPRFADHSLRLGLPAVLAVPLRANGELVGALDVYQHRPRWWADDEVEAILLLADVVGAAVLTSRRLAASLATVERVQEGAAQRRAVDQATGMVAERLDVGLEDAEVHLRRLAGARGVSLVTVAKEVLTRRAVTPDVRPRPTTAPDGPVDEMLWPAS